MKLTPNSRPWVTDEIEAHVDDVFETVRERRPIVDRHELKHQLLLQLLLSVPSLGRC